jgi:hypothetical protein
MNKMRSHRSFIVISGALLVAVAALLYALLTIARHVAIARLQAITKRPVAIDRVRCGRRPVGSRSTGFARRRRAVHAAGCLARVHPLAAALPRRARGDDRDDISRSSKSSKASSTPLSHVARKRRQPP